MTPRILVIGPVVFDVQFVSGGPAVRHPGGNGLVFAATVARLGLSATIRGHLSDDDRSLAIRTLLESSGVDLGGIATTPGSPTKTVEIELDSDGAWNLLRSYPKPHAYMPDPSPIDPRDFDRLHVAGFNSLLRSDAAATASQIDAFRGVGRPVSFGLNGFSEGQEDIVADRIKSSEAVFCNAEEFGRLVAVDVTGADSVTRELERCRFDRCVVTIGASGAIAKDEGEIVRIAAPTVEPVVSTVGAGDVLSAVYFRARLGRESPRPALEAACKAASHTVRFETWDGGLADIPSARSS